MRHPVRTTIAILGLALAATACGGDTADSADGISTADARVRAVAPGMEATAVYVDITNDGDTDDELIGAAVPEDVAGTVELHETVVMEDSTGMDDASETAMEDMTETEMADTEMADDMASEGDHTDGMAGMTMQQVESIAVPAGETVALEPGGLHIMLLDLADPVDATEIDVTLEFAEAGEVTVSAPVVDNP